MKQISAGLRLACFRVRCTYVFPLVRAGRMETQP